MSCSAPRGPSPRMVATRDFSGLTSSACALARAAAKLAIDGLDRFENRPGAFDPAVQSRGHPAERRMRHLLLHVGKDLPGAGLIPSAGSGPRWPGRELDNEIAGQVLGLDLAPLLPPEPQEGSLVIAHDDLGV